MIDAIANHNYDFGWVALESGIKVNSTDQSFSGKLYLRMKKDSIIWAVAKKSGVEGGRILVNKNKYAAINRLDGTYTRGTTSTVMKQNGINLSFLELQNALFGNIPVIPKENRNIIETDLLDGKYIVEYKSDSLNVEYTINSESLNIDQVKISQNKNVIYSTFSDYKSVDNVVYPFRRTITLYDNLTGESSIKLEVKKVQLEIPKKTTFTIPPHYEEVK